MFYCSRHAHSVQEPALFCLVHWTTFVKVSQRGNVQETFFDSSRKILPIYRLYCTTKKTHLYYQPKEYESLHDTEVRKETFTGYQTYIAKFICLVLTVFSNSLQLHFILHNLYDVILDSLIVHHRLSKNRSSRYHNSSSSTFGGTLYADNILRDFSLDAIRGKVFSIVG